MRTFVQQTLQFTEDKSTSLPVDSLVNHTQWQEKDLEKRMNAICGQKCLERFEKFNHVGSWAKTFSALLIGQTGWFSTRCKLTWKMKGTKYNRMYFQLHPSTLPTEGTEFGLLPTPLAQAREQTNFEAYDQRMERLKKKGHKPFTMPLDQMALRGMLPTPIASDCRVHYPTENWKGTSDLGSVINGINGTRSHLSPQFVLEMMGFPTDWTILPFLNGEMNQSKREETQ